MTCVKLHPSLPYVQVSESRTHRFGTPIREIYITMPDCAYRFLTHTDSVATNPYDRLRGVLHEAQDLAAPAYLRTQIPLLRRAIEELRRLFPYGNRSVRDALWTLSRHVDSLPAHPCRDWELIAITLILAALLYFSGVFA